MAAPVHNATGVIMIKCHFSRVIRVWILVSSPEIPPQTSLAAAEPHNTLLYEALEYVDSCYPPYVRTFSLCTSPRSPARTSFDPVILSKFADPDLIITTLILSLRRRRGANTAHTQKLELRAPDGATPIK